MYKCRFLVFTCVSLVAGSEDALQYLQSRWVFISVFEQQGHFIDLQVQSPTGISLTLQTLQTLQRVFCYMHYAPFGFIGEVKFELVLFSFPCLFFYGQLLENSCRTTVHSDMKTQRTEINVFRLCTPLFRFVSSASARLLLCASQKHIFLPELLDEILSLLDDVDGDLQCGLLLLAEAFDQILHSFHRFSVHVVQQLLLQLLQPCPQLKQNMYYGYI